MSPRTKRNLRSALEFDAVDAATLQTYAARARAEEAWEAAKAFQEGADIDRIEHFALEAKLQGLINETPENLRRVIEAERNESQLFARFAEEARLDGDLGSASAFDRISGDKKVRCRRFEELLANMGVHSAFETIAP